MTKCATLPQQGQHEREMVNMTALVAYHYYEAVHRPECRGQWTSPAAYACTAAARRREEFHALTDADVAKCCAAVTDMMPEWFTPFILDPYHIR